MDGDDSRSNDPSTLPVDSLPVPVVGYDARDGDPVLMETNDAFETTFEGDLTGTTIRRWLQTASRSDDAAIDEVCSTLASGRAVDTDIEVMSGNAATADTEAYRLRTCGGTTGADGIEGYILLTESTSGRDDGVAADRIASVVSHDLRNPLDVANAHLRAARETGAEEHFDEVRRSHERMERIIRDVLTLARGENALDVVADVDIGSVAADAWATVDTGGADLSLAGDMPTTDADPDRLQRLFENLFRNSVEHARPPEDRTGWREAKEHANTTNGSDADQPLQVRVGSTTEGFFVADDGVGIAEEERESVFDPGYSSGGTGDGTGLGLTIVERIAAAHDLRVSVATGTNGGARFEFQPRSSDD